VTHGCQGSKAELEIDAKEPYLFHLPLVKRYPLGQAKKREKWKYK
jgi:hypothetical protein